MAKTVFVWLGSRRTRKHPIGGKGRLLDVAASRGLPVPNGGILLHELYQLLLVEGVIREQGRAVQVPDPVWLHETLFAGVRFPRLNKLVAIRPAYSLVAPPAGEANGDFTCSLRIDMSDPHALSAGLGTVWSSALAWEEPLRCDALIMEMVAVQMAGKVFMSQAEAQDGVVLAGETGASLVLPWLARWQRPLPDVPPFAQRLQQLLRGVRHTFGQRASSGENWVVDWADDGRVCWLLRLRAVKG